MTTAAQREATSAHRQRAKTRGLARVEVQVPAGDVALVKQLAEGLRGEHAGDVRKVIEVSLISPAERTGLDLFDFATPEQQTALDDLFHEILSEPRSSEIREIDL